MNLFKKEFKWWANKLFFRAYRYRRIERRHLLPLYSTDAAPTVSHDRMLIMMGDGKRHHGGLADRLRAIVSVYSICKENGLRFAIRFTFPFELEKYLSPASYDWTLKPGEFTMNSKDARPYYTDTIGIRDAREPAWELSYLKKHIMRSPFKQLHVYSPFDFVTDGFSTLFNELFKPSPLLESALMPHRQGLTIRGGYVSVSTRFLELLGDFVEPKAKKKLSDEHQRLSLIASCKSKLEEIHRENPDSTILLTSDSKRFLDACADLPYVYIVEGEIAHSDVAGSDGHLKTFLDFWLISEARKAYQLRTGGMYDGNFSRRAAMAGGIPHKLIEF